MERLAIRNAGIEAPEKSSESKIASSRDWIVLVYDNDQNTMEEVHFILILATGCNQNEAEIETWEVHHLGKSVVHNAGEQECLRVAEIISTIGIRVEVLKED